MRSVRSISLSITASTWRLTWIFLRPLSWDTTFLQLPASRASAHAERRVWPWSTTSPSCRRTLYPAPSSIRKCPSVAMVRSMRVNSVTTATPPTATAAVLPASTSRMVRVVRLTATSARTTCVTVPAYAPIPIRPSVRSATRTPISVPMITATAWEHACSSAT